MKFYNLSQLEDFDEYMVPMQHGSMKDLFEDHLMPVIDEARLTAWAQGITTMRAVLDIAGRGNAHYQVYNKKREDRYQA